MEDVDYSFLKWFKEQGDHSPDPLVETWMKAASAGDPAAIIAFLDSGIDINVRDQGRGQTALFLAVYHSQLDTIRVLLERGAGLNYEDCYGYTVLTHAIRQSQPRFWDLAYVPDPEPLNLLKAAGAHYNLIDAFWSNDVELARVRLEEGANPDHGKGSYHGPLLMEAARAGTLEMIDLLLDHGADIEAEDDLGSRPLLSAVEYRQIEAVRRLLDRGADIDAQNWSGLSALGIAAIGDFHEIVDLLFTRGARRGIADALALNDPTILATLLDGEIRKGREIDWICDLRGRIAMVAASSGHPSLVRLILDRGASHLARFDGHSLLAEAASQGHLEVMKLLMDRGANLEAVGDDGLTPLAWAIKEGRDEAANWLRRAGALPEGSSIPE